MNEIILLWTVWVTFFTASPEREALRALCRRTHPEAELSVTTEFIRWRGRSYPSFMLVCSRPADGGGRPPAPEPRERPRSPGKTPT